MNIEPIITYTSLAWNTVNRSDVKRLQLIENSVLRTIANTHYYVSNAILHRDLKIETIDEHF
ncbi:hypothetical protein X975_09857, partial [Stegodyphus mimosarum]